MSEQLNPTDTETSEVENVAALEVPPAIEVPPAVEPIASPIVDAHNAAIDTSSGPAEFAQSEGGRTGRSGGATLKLDDIDYKNVTLLSRFLDRRGRILSRRKTRASAKVQRKIAEAVRRARQLALLPYTADQTRIVRKRR